MLNALKSIGKTVGKFVLNQFGLSVGGVQATAAGQVIQTTDTLTTILTKIAEQQLAGARAGLSADVKRVLVAAVVEQVFLEYFHTRNMKLKTGHDFEGSVRAAVGALYDVWDDFESNVQTTDVGSVVAAAPAVPVAPPTGGQ